MECLFDRYARMPNLVKQIWTALSDLRLNGAEEAAKEAEELHKRLAA